MFLSGSHVGALKVSAINRIAIAVCSVCPAVSRICVVAECFRVLGPKIREVASGHEGARPA